MEKPSKTMPCAMNSRFSPFQKKSKNRCQNDLQKSWKIIQNGTPGQLGSIYSSFLCISGNVEKTWFFDVALGRRKINKNRALGRQGPPCAPRLVAKSGIFGIEGPRAPRARYYKTIKQRAVRWIVWHADGRWPGEFLSFFVIFFGMLWATHFNLVSSPTPWRVQQMAVSVLLMTRTWCF